MATLPLFPKQMDALLQQITLAMNANIVAPGLILANPDNLTPAQNYYGVRCEWQNTGQPFQESSEDVIYVRAIEVDDPYNRERYENYLENYGEENNQITNYSRIWEVSWCCYGPNSFDNARQLRSALFQQTIHDLFANSQLYMVTDPAAPVRAPEYENGQWWERVDFKCRFNEFVTEVIAQPMVLSAEIIVEDSNGIVAEIPVESA